MGNISRGVLALSLLVLCCSCQNKSYPVNPGAPSFTLLFPPLFSNFGSQGTAEGQFNRPSGIAIDSNGDLYVADAGNYRVEKFDTNWNYLDQWQDKALDILDKSQNIYCGPIAVAVDSSGNLYASTPCNDVVEKFNSNGNSSVSWGGFGKGNGQFNLPQGVAVASSGNIYVADDVNNRIQVFNGLGQYISQWGNKGSGNGQFYYPQGIAVDSLGNIYVTDSGNNRVEKFDSNGNYLIQWGSGGTVNGLFNIPIGIALDPSDHVYVADGGNNRIEEFDSSGNYLAQWGSKGSGNEQFHGPQGLAADSNWNLYVTDWGNNRIQKISFFPIFNGLAPGNLAVYPNPVNNGENLQFGFVLSASVGFSIVVKDDLGKEVMQYQGQGAAGENLLRWNGVPTVSDYSMGSGAYYAVLNSGSSAATAGFSYLP